jgi:hypothetical protein
MFLKRASLTVFLLASSTVSAQEEAARFERAYEHIDAFVRRSMEQEGTPGLALALTSRDALLRVAAYGFADAKARVPLTPETLFEIGSISKSFTALALMQLMEEGRFDPHAPVTRFFELFLLRFGRDNGAVVEVAHGSDWFAGADYAGPRTFDHPDEWRAYPGHYRTPNPWFSNFRVVLRKGQLRFVDPGGDEEPTTPLEPGLFRIGAEHSAERLRLDAVVRGKTQRATLSGVPYYRSFTP